jgi:hypothetical protein
VECLLFCLYPHGHPAPPGCWARAVDSADGCRCMGDGSGGRSTTDDDGAYAGTVTFCNAAAASCEDTAILGKAQLVAETQPCRIIPAIGSHTYKAIFQRDDNAAAASTSSAQTLTVTGLYPTTTALAATGNPSGYDTDGNRRWLCQSTAGPGRKCNFSGHDRQQPPPGNRALGHTGLQPALHRGAGFPGPDRQPALPSPGWGTSTRTEYQIWR